jgi:predicted transcriptional regulator
MLPSIERIAERRKRLGLTQSQLAELAGVSQSYIAKLEAGKIEPSYRKVKAILDALQWVEDGRGVKAGNIMSRDVICIKADEPVRRAAELMMRYGYSQLPVLEEGRVVGSISEKTIVERFMEGENGPTLAERPVSEVMDEAFPQVGEETPLSILTALLRVYPAVLVTMRGEIIGIVTKADLLKTLEA